MIFKCVPSVTGDPSTKDFSLQLCQLRSIPGVGVAPCMAHRCGRRRGLCQGLVTIEKTGTIGKEETLIIREMVKCIVSYKACTVKPLLSNHIKQDIFLFFRQLVAYC